MRSLFGDGTDSEHIGARLAEIASDRSEPPAWLQGLRRLQPESPLAERLAVYLAVRGSGVLPEDAGLFLVARIVHEIAEIAAETELEPFAEELEAIAADEGFDRDGWPAGEPPAEHDAVLDRHEAAWCELFARTLAEHAPDLARLYRADRREFEVRSGTGREFFRGADDPQWLTRLVAEVAACLKDESMLVRPVAQWRAGEDGFEVTIFPRPSETVVGARDGEVVAPRLRDRRGRPAGGVRADRRPDVDRPGRAGRAAVPLRARAPSWPPAPAADPVRGPGRRRDGEGRPAVNGVRRPGRSTGSDDDRDSWSELFIALPVNVGTEDAGGGAERTLPRGWVGGGRRVGSGTARRGRSQPVGGGARRPGELTSESHWEPFRDANGVSGHSFMGALPFLTAARLAEDPWLKLAFYGGSTLAPLSRINDGAHYPSEAFLGWRMAWAATAAVPRSDADLDARGTLQPLPHPNATSLAVEVRF